MRAAARVVAERDARGRTRLAVLHGEPPLLPRLTGEGRVHLVGGAAGPLGGDDLLLSLEVGPGATLRVGTVAASVVLPGRDGAPSRVRVAATVADGGCLIWVPEPLVAAARCHHHSSSTVDIAGDARLVWREELICGRYRESPGDAVLSTVVRRAGQPLYRNELRVGPQSPGWDGPAVLGGARVVGSVLVVDPSWSDGDQPAARTLGPDAALLPLAGPAVIALAAGADAHGVRALLDRVTADLGAGRDRTGSPAGQQPAARMPVDGHAA
jgi:urease accessory protein